MEISVGDRVEMKKQHPCGNKIFIVTRTGVDFKLKYEKCNREILSPRIKIKKYIKKVLE